ncbi:MAG: hypothetical protein M1825_005505 [Sarcosagium campestre]|nr:MAG: hypothetical protein M1825_005505 [Sarcosagium campestre]
MLTQALNKEYQSPPKLSSSDVSQPYSSLGIPRVEDGVSSLYVDDDRLQLPEDLPRERYQVSVASGSAADDSEGPVTYSSSTRDRQASLNPYASASGTASQSESLTNPESPSADQDDTTGDEDSSARRKRSKVSRACDECRRKKIRCDANTEDISQAQCSSCKRVGLRCAFGRIPMKRGPSKGYIKELAERVNTLENSIIPSPSDMQPSTNEQGSQSPHTADEQSPPSSATSGPASYPRKRTYSSANDGPNPLMLQTLPQRLSVGSISNSESFRHLPFPASTLQTPQTSRSTTSMSDGNRLQPQRQPMVQPFWNARHPMGSRRESAGAPYETIEGGDDGVEILDWDDKTINEYYRTIHPTFPLLPNSKRRLRSRLANCPCTLRDAFLEALYAAVRSFPSTDPGPASDFHGTKRASDLIAASQYESIAMRTTSTNLIYLQSMILMALEADNHGPATMKGQLGPPRAVWLGSAVGLANSMRLYRANRCSKLTNGDVDSDEKMCRRVWWVLVILDRWHASSTSSPVYIPDSILGLLPEDQSVLGESVYHLARLSCIIGHLAHLFVGPADIMDPSTMHAPVIGKLLHGEIERFRESIDSRMQSLNLVHLSYWHVKLLMLRHAPTSEPSDLIGPAQRMASILNSVATPMTPLNHHFAALAALTLVELADFRETRTGAWKGILSLHEALDKRRGFYAHEDSSGWDSAIRDLIVKKEHQMRGGGVGPVVSSPGGLHHLADMAVNSATQVAMSSPAGPPTSMTVTAPPPSTPVPALYETTQPTFDPTVITRYGYLAVLVNEYPR